MPFNTFPVVIWNHVALEANRADFTLPGPQEEGGPTLSSRALAIVHIAMYDAFFGIAGGKPTYTGGAPPASGLAVAAIPAADSRTPAATGVIPCSR